MPRRRLVRKREIGPDPKYNDVIIAKLINNIIRDGKKSLAEKIVYGAFDLISKKLNTEGATVFKQAMENVKPVLEVKARRVGGATYQIPMEVPFHRKISLALKWTISSAEKRTEKTMIERLANEIMDASKNTGAAVKKREDTHKMAEANKAFAHFRW
ncbi:MAG: 30S ribosomal protein S7 [Candidatus Firestonebacteria bacterium]